MDKVTNTDRAEPKPSLKNNLSLKRSTCNNSGSTSA